MQVVKYEESMKRKVRDFLTQEYEKYRDMEGWKAFRYKFAIYLFNTLQIKMFCDVAETCRVCHEHGTIVGVSLCDGAYHMVAKDNDSAIMGRLLGYTYGTQIVLRSNNMVRNLLAEVLMKCSDNKLSMCAINLEAVGISVNVPSTYTITDTEADDVDLVYRAIVECDLRTGESKLYVRGDMSQNTKWLALRDVNGAIVSCLEYRSCGEAACVDVLYTVEQCRGMGLGSMLLSVLFNKLKQEDYESCWAQTDNALRTSFFTKRGMSVIDEVEYWNEC